MCRGSGTGDSGSTQRHWLEYSFAISLRPANQARYLRVVSGSIVSVDGRSSVSRLRRASPTKVGRECKLGRARLRRAPHFVMSSEYASPARTETSLCHRSEERRVGKEVRERW